MSYDLELDENWDLKLSDGDAVMVGDIQRVRQQVKATLQTWLGEWFLDTTFGVPYLESILIKNPQRQQIESVLRSKIKDVPSVNSVPKMDLLLDAEGRTLKVTTSIISDYATEAVEVKL